ncbi:MAG: pimeloyl-ACP methyl ester esterase BioH [Thiomicrospira sp.]|jgi:pimeloyl-[acyl-carrier protein] methyl ester esterase|nr:pimeloyl-ACP methyl ester esterase BioH [Thiomicrospira sp.]
MAVILNTHTFGCGPSLSLIHGWGAQNSVWQDWAQAELAADFTVTLIELPGFGDSPKIEAVAGEAINEAWLAALAAALPPKTHLLGWSLGGLMAQQLALRLPQQVQSLICLATTPRFVQAQGWSWAVSPALMADFMKALGVDSVALVQRFWKIQLQGGDGARQLIKHLTAHLKDKKIPTFAALLQGLEFLRDIDMRDQLAQIQQPTLWLFGEKDPLIPPDLARTLAQLQPSAQIQTIQGAAHLPFASHPEQTADLIKGFLFNEAV